MVIFGQRISSYYCYRDIQGTPRLKLSRFLSYGASKASE